VAVLRYWLWLSLKQGIGPKRIHTLLSRFGNPEEVYRADRRTLETCPGIKADEIAQLVDKDLTVAENVFNLCREKRIKILTPEHELYPKLLLEIPDPPYVLYARYAERINLNDHMTVAVVGTRKATPYGLTTAEKLSAIMASQGITVVSGMALGNDAAAHWGALLAGGKTVAVLAGGVDKPSPPSHAKLMREIIKNGMVLSEYPPGTPSLPHHFRARNRIISGLSRGTVVVEAPEGSGALITSGYALAQNRDVFVVPADITSSFSVGSNKLLAQGAIPVLGPMDVYHMYETNYSAIMEKNRPVLSQQKPIELYETEEIMAEKPNKQRVKKSEQVVQTDREEPKQPLPELTEEEQAVLAHLSKDPIHIDQLAAKGFSPAMLSATLTTLEMKGVVQAMSGKRFCLM